MSTTAEAIQNGFDFSVNEECTSLKLVPSGNQLIAGFSDGTLRLFDLTCPDTTGNNKKSKNSIDDEEESLFDLDSSDEENQVPIISKSRKQVLSTPKQQGLVLCQIHARGVHTSLLMHVDVSQDGKYCFGGVARGSVELVAVKLDDHSTHVYRHSDAKLRGFGACTKLFRKDNSKNKNDTYMLLTGRGIKNIHIWSFTPKNESDALWQCLYDTQTNGNSILMLTFRYDSRSHLQAISKSDDQKLRVWDLSQEQQQEHENRPKRPKHKDVASTESALGMAGGFCVCSGGNLYNQMSVVSLEAESPYNHTELALPSAGSGGTSKRRAQRGELTSIVSMAGIKSDAGHVLLELSNGSLVLYSQHGDGGLPKLETLDSALFSTQQSATSRQMCLAKSPQGVVVAAVAEYNNITGRGSISLRSLKGSMQDLWSSKEQVSSNKSSKPSDETVKVARSDKMSAPLQVLPSSQAYPIVTPKSTKRRKTGPKQTPASIQASRHSVVADSPQAESAPAPKPQASAKERPKVQTTSDVAATAQQVSPESKTPPPEKPVDGAMMKFLRRPKESDAEEQVTTEKPAAAVAKRPASAVAATKSAPVTSESDDTPTDPVLPVKRKRGRPKKRKILIPNSNAYKAAVRAGWTPDKQPNPDTNGADALVALRNKVMSPPRAKSPRPGFLSPNRRPGFLSPHRRTLPPSLLTGLPKTTVAERMGVANPNALQKLVLSHRADHEMLRNKVLASADYHIRSLVASPPTSVDHARNCLEADIASYNDLLNDMLGRQQMEASSLAALESFKTQQVQVAFTVSFPFPEVFAQARNSFQSFLDS